MHVQQQPGQVDVRGGLAGEGQPRGGECRQRGKLQHPAAARQQEDQAGAQQRADKRQHQHPVVHREKGPFVTQPSIDHPAPVGPLHDQLGPPQRHERRARQDAAGHGQRRRHERGKQEAPGRLFRPARQPRGKRRPQHAKQVARRQPSSRHDHDRQTHLPRGKRLAQQHPLGHKRPRRRQPHQAHARQADRQEGDRQAVPRPRQVADPIVPDHQLDRPGRQEQRTLAQGM